MATPFDITEVSNKMLSAARESVGDGWKKSDSVFREFTRNNAERMAMLADLCAAGEITQEQLDLRLKGEKDMLEAQLNALNVIAASTVQKTVNSVFDILTKAICAVIPG